MADTGVPEHGPARLVTFLGLGDERRGPERYEPRRYRLGALETEPTPHHDVATLLALGTRVKSLVVLGTPEVRQLWFTPVTPGAPGLYAAGLAQHIQPLPPLLFQPIPSRPQASAQLWELFTRVTQCLSPQPLELLTPEGVAWREPVAPAEIVFDITHGHRVSPFFAATAVAFVLAQRRRERATEAPRLRILYSAPPAAGEQAAEVWDISQFIHVLEWDAAVEDLLRHGRADGLEQLARQQQKQKYQPGQQPSQWMRLGKASRDFADALATVRLGAVLTEAAGKLSEALRDTRAEVVKDIPPLAQAMDTLERWTGELRAPRAVSREGAGAALRLVGRYLDLERFAEATCALRETVVTLASLLRPGEEQALLQPGQPGVLAQRAEVEHSLGEAEALSRQPPQGSPTPGSQQWPPRLLKLWNAVGQLRNDVLHAGFNESPAPASRLRDRLHEQSKAARELLEELLERRHS